MLVFNIAPYPWRVLPRIRIDEYQANFRKSGGECRTRYCLLTSPVLLVLLVRLGLLRQLHLWLHRPRLVPRLLHQLRHRPHPWLHRLRPVLRLQMRRELVLLPVLRWWWWL